MNHTNMDLVELQAPFDSDMPEITLLSGRTVRPDPDGTGRVVVHPDEASQLLARGWSVVRAIPPRRAA
jgi:hypothetical protein